jgi:predicted CXXCH cytochrome family protein
MCRKGASSIFVVLLIAVATVAGAQGIVGTAHDLSSKSYAPDGRICVFCHTPHQSSAASAQDPLWNHELSQTPTYGVYGSLTMQAVPTDVGGATAGAANVSQLCLSCHDGTIAIGATYNGPLDTSEFVTGGANLGTNLSDDHPINFTYDDVLANLDSELTVPDSASAVDPSGNIPLFDGKVQCATCHDAHDDTNGPFLVVNNNASALCLNCHIK